MKRQNKMIKKEREPAHYKLADWLLKQSGGIPREKIADAILKLSETDELKAKDFGSFVSRARQRLEQKYGYTLIYSSKFGSYRTVKKGTFDASRFTMGHYRRAVLAASRAQELNDLGFLNPAHIDALVEEVMSKASKRTKGLAQLKTVLLSKWKALRTQERKALQNEKTN